MSSKSRDKNQVDTFVENTNNKAVNIPDAMDFVTMFEQKLCEFTNAPYCVAVDCCSHALFMALKLYKPTEVICPTHTYVSVPMQILHAGHKLKFKKFSWVGTYQLDPFNILDCAVYFRKNMYQKGTIQCLSFQYKKRFYVNRGGAILLDNEEQYNLLKLMKHDGRDESILYKDIEDIPNLGYHYYMSAESACAGLLNFDRMLPSSAKSDRDYRDVSKFSCFAKHKNVVR